MFGPSMRVCYIFAEHHSLILILAFELDVTNFVQYDKLNDERLAQQKLDEIPHQ